MSRGRRPALLATASLAAAGLTTAGGLATAGPAAGQASQSLYVSPAAVSDSADTSCTTAAYPTVTAAVAAAPRGATVVVCKGRYAEFVTVRRLLTLRGRSGAVIDATGHPYGVGLAASGVTVRGLTVEHATDDTSQSWPGAGIATFGFTATGKVVVGNRERIVGNRLTGNQGPGIDVDSTHGTLVAGNTSTGNALGINLTDDYHRPAYRNTLHANVVRDSTSQCGIVLAEHSGSGVYRNTVSGNTSHDNGRRAAAAGILVAGYPTTGGVHDNLIRHNRTWGNTLAGLVMHVHRKGSADWNGNRFVDNVIGRNNVGFRYAGHHVADWQDGRTTGIYVGVAKRVTLVITGNRIRRDHYGVFVAGRVGGRHAGNRFRRVRQHWHHLVTYQG